MATWNEDRVLSVQAPDGPDMADVPSDVVPLSARIGIIIPRGKVLPRSVDEVIAWGRDQIKNPTQDWTGKCQSFCRQSYGVRAWAPSAITAWNKIPARHKHQGGKPSEAPRGALIYFAGGQFGHVSLAIGKKTHDKCLSNDYVRHGQINVAPRDFPRWGLRYVGWSLWTPFGSLDA